MIPKNQSALIVDDDPGVRDVLAVILAQRGWSVDTVEDAEHAIENLSSHTYTVVVVDTRARHIDRDFVERLRPVAPLVVIVSSDDATRGLGPSVSSVILREPIEVRDLAAIVNAIEGAVSLTK